jgi:hypothetical protein
MKIIIFLALILLISNIKTQNGNNTINEGDRQANTRKLIQQINNIYGEDKLYGFAPCVYYSNCSECSSQGGCIMVLGADDTYFQVVSQGKTLIYQNNVDFCWQGGFYGATQVSKTVEIIATGKLNSSTITVEFGWNEYTWLQVSLKIKKSVQ